MPHARLVATDLDRTLLGPGGLLTERSRAAMAAARARGIAVVAVTARPPRAFEAWTALGGVVDTAICANGAMTYDPRTSATTTHHTLTPAAAELVATRLREAAPRVRFAVETGPHIVCEPAYSKIDSVLDRRVIADSLDAVLATDTPFVKLLAHIEGGSADDLLRVAGGLDLGGVELWHSGSRDQLEFGPAGVSKASALAAWCAVRDIDPAQVVAFGDAPTDAPMLAWAGRSYAVADAHPVAAAAATDWCGSSERDGVARVIETLTAP